MRRWKNLLQGLMQCSKSKVIFRKEQETGCMKIINSKTNETTSPAGYETDAPVLRRQAEEPEGKPGQA